MITQKMTYLIYINKNLMYNYMDNDIENQITNDEIKKYVVCLVQYIQV